MAGKGASLWEQAKANLVELYETAAEKTDELAKVGARKIDKISISRHLERHFTELGGMVYHLHAEGRLEEVGTDEKVKALLVRLAELKGDLKRKDEEIDAIREEKRRKKGAETTESGGEASGS